jgi:hypothetical protein
MDSLQPTLDRRGQPLDEGDRVLSNLGERGLVTRAVGGPLINVRLDSSGRMLSSSASLWTKLDP